MPETKEIVFFAERTDEGLHRSALELAALSRSLAGALNGLVSAVWIGADDSESARELIAYGAEKVYVIEGPPFEGYQPEAYVAALEQVCRKVEPELFLFGHTLYGVDLAPRLAWRLKSGLSTDSVALTVEEASGQVKVERPVYGAKAEARLRSRIKPLVATVRSKAVSPAEKDEGRSGEVIAFPVDVDPSALRIKYIERVKESTAGPKLEDAEVVVSGGRGLGSAENFSLLEELAGLLGGVVGGSRVAIDRGWLPSSRQVGLTGTMVSPRLYIAVGISGATQHMAGCGNSQCIVAINTDPDAPIFSRAHLGIVADFKQVIPKLIELYRAS